MILFAGDSFSYQDDADTWVGILSKKLTLPFLNFSIGGSSLWYTYEKLTDYAVEKLVKDKKISYIIITCTNKDRVPFCEYPEKSHVKNDNIQKIENLLDVDFTNFVYYTKFYSLKLHNFLYKEMLNRLIAIYGNHTKVVLLSCFGDNLNFFDEIYSYDQNFIFCKTPLLKFAKLDTENIKYKNHMNNENNFLIANALYNNLSNITNGPFTINEN